MICQICNINESKGVASCGLAPISLSICQDCLTNNCEPKWVVDFALEINDPSDYILDNKTVFINNEYITLRKYTETL